MILRTKILNSILFMEKIMKKFIVAVFIVSPMIANAGNTPEKAFDSRPVFPTVEKMQNVDWIWQNFT